MSKYKNNGKKVEHVKGQINVRFPHMKFSLKIGLGIWRWVFYLVKTEHHFWIAFFFALFIAIFEHLFIFYIDLVVSFWLWTPCCSIWETIYRCLWRAVFQWNVFHLCNLEFFVLSFKVFIWPAAPQIINGCVPQDGRHRQGRAGAELCKAAEVPPDPGGAAVKASESRIRHRTARHPSPITQRRPMPNHECNRWHGLLYVCLSTYANHHCWPLLSLFFLSPP